MDEILPPRSAPKTAIEYRAAIDEMLAEMTRLNGRMKLDQAEIERLGAETAAIRTGVRALLAEMGAPL